MEKKPTKNLKDIRPEGKTVSGIPSESNDVLETAELLRAAATLLRMTVGIVAMSSNMCKAEVFDKPSIKSINEAYSTLFDSFRTLYASLMGRYNALSASDSVGSPKNVPSNN